MASRWRLLCSCCSAANQDFSLLQTHLWPSCPKCGFGEDERVLVCLISTKGDLSALSQARRGALGTCCRIRPEHLPPNRPKLGARPRSRLPGAEGPFHGCVKRGFPFTSGPASPLPCPEGGMLTGNVTNHLVLAKPDVQGRSVFGPSLSDSVETIWHFRPQSKTFLGIVKAASLHLFFFFFQFTF